MAIINNPDPFDFRSNGLWYSFVVLKALVLAESFLIYCEIRCNRATITVCFAAKNRRERFFVQDPKG